MNLSSIPLLLLSLYSYVAWSADTTSANFLADKQVRVLVQAEGNTVSYRLIENPCHEGEIARRQFENERPLHIEVGDYNFDGHEDFAVWHLDDGMGVHKIYRIFLYTPGQKTFEEALSRCGDTFINVRRDLKRRRLLSTHWSDNTPMSCVTRLPKTPGGHAQK